MFSVMQTMHHRWSCSRQMRPGGSLYDQWDWVCVCVCVSSVCVTTAFLICVANSLISQWHTHTHTHTHIWNACNRRSIDEMYERKQTPSVDVMCSHSSEKWWSVLKSSCLHACMRAGTSLHRTFLSNHGLRCAAGRHYNNFNHWHFLP